MEDFDSEQILFESIAIAPASLFDNKTEEAGKLWGTNEGWAGENLSQFLRDSLVRKFVRGGWLFRCLIRPGWPHKPIICALPHPSNSAASAGDGPQTAIVCPTKPARTGPGGLRESGRRFPRPSSPSCDGRRRRRTGGKDRPLRLW